MSFSLAFFTRCTAPLNAQGMQNEFISQSQLAAIQDDPEGITNDGVAGDAPSLMTGDTRAVTTERTLPVLIARG
jgi:hypothetical protein